MAQPLSPLVAKADKHVVEMSAEALAEPEGGCDAYVGNLAHNSISLVPKNITNSDKFNVHSGLTSPSTCPSSSSAPAPLPAWGGWEGEVGHTVGKGREGGQV